jgi:hypothetical protein
VRSAWVVRGCYVGGAQVLRGFYMGATWRNTTSVPRIYKVENRIAKEMPPKKNCEIITICFTLLPYITNIRCKFIYTFFTLTYINIYLSS